MNNEEKAAPASPSSQGLKVMELSGLHCKEGDEIVERLYQLSYIKNNAVRTTLLLFSEATTIDIYVEKAKEFCKSKKVNFSWLEKAINQIELGEEK